MARQERSFTIEVDGTLAPGIHTNPALTNVQYSVSGVLTGTPSGFPGFALRRTIGGSEFYAQGSSLEFEITAFADLSDGLQISEFRGFVFDGREVNTGRYHPPLLQFSPDGTGSIRNSNNTGGVNPFSMQVVTVDFGEEYMVGLGFASAVPAPATVWLLATGLLGVGGRGWLKRKAAHPRHLSR